MLLINSNILSPYDKIAIAVSGGPDSLAMLYLLHSLDKKLVALTIDHNLREESKKEAEYVARICKELGIEHHILEWKHNGISSNIHDQARKARYELMTEFCKANNIDVICTGHHADDRIENFFIRIHQGAGLFGLIDKDHITYNGINIVRPLFHLRKKDILEYLRKNKIRYCEDKSNEDPKYLRSNIRKWLSMMPEELDPDLFAKRVISVKHNLERASELVERIFEAEFAKVEIFEEGYAIIKSLVPDQEVAYMILSKMLSIIGDGGDLIRLESIERLYNSTKSKNTLGGCLIHRHPEGVSFARKQKACDRQDLVNQTESLELTPQILSQGPYALPAGLRMTERCKSTIIITREFGKNPPKDIALKDDAIWDDRFKILCKKSYKNLTISYLKKEEYAEIKKDLTYPQNLERHIKKNKEIIFTLPIVKNLEKVIAIPHINYYDDAYSDLRHNLKFEFIRKNR